MRENDRCQIQPPFELRIRYTPDENTFRPYVA
jgi:hypothetical protein